MDTDVQRFLDAEEAAVHLAEVLTRLVDEVGSYQTAGEALDQAASSVGGLAARCADIVEQLGSLARTLRSIGTPELLRGLEVLISKVDMLNVALDGTQQSMIETHQLGVQRSEHLAEQVGKLQNALGEMERSVVAKQWKPLAEKVGKLQNALDAMRGQQAKALDSRVIELQTALADLRNQQAADLVSRVEELQTALPKMVAEQLVPLAKKVGDLQDALVAMGNLRRQCGLALAGLGLLVIIVGLLT